MIYNTKKTSRNFIHVDSFVMPKNILLTFICVHNIKINNWL